MSSAGRMTIGAGNILYSEDGGKPKKLTKAQAAEIHNNVAGQLEYALNLLAPLRKDLAGTRELLAATQGSFSREKERADAMADAINQRTTDETLAALLSANIKAVSNRANACGWEVGGIQEAAKAILVAGYRRP